MAGDGFCQFVVERKMPREYDVRRGVRFFILPAFYIAPILSRWFRVLERVGGNPKFLPLKKVAIDQVNSKQKLFKRFLDVFCSSIFGVHHFQFTSPTRLVSQRVLSKIEISVHWHLQAERYLLAHCAIG